MLSPSHCFSFRGLSRSVRWSPSLGVRPGSSGPTRPLGPRPLGPPGCGRGRSGRVDPGSSASPLLTVGSSARVQGRSAAARPRYTLTGGQEGHRGPLGPTCSGREPDARRARRARASGACVHSCTWLTARTGALSRRVRGCWRPARTQASLAAPAGRGTSFPTQEGRQGAAPTWAVLG